VLCWKGSSFQHRPDGWGFNCNTVVALSCTCSVSWSYRLLSYQQTSPPWNRPRTWRRTVVPQSVPIRHLTGHQCSTTWRHRGPQTTPTLTQVWGIAVVRCCFVGYHRIEQVSAAVTLKTHRGLSLVRVLSRSLAILTKTFVIFLSPSR
jgi:hypothetical protein